MSEFTTQSARNVQPVESVLEKLVKDRIIFGYRIFSEDEYVSVLKGYIPAKEMHLHRPVVVFCRVPENQSPLQFQPVVSFVKTNALTKKKVSLKGISLVSYRIQSYVIDSLNVFLIFSNEKIEEFFENKAVQYNHDQTYSVLGV